MGFCILKKQAHCSTWFIFLCLICHFLVRHFLAKCGFHSSFAVVMPMQKADKNRSLGKIQKLIQQTFRDQYWTAVHVLWNLHPRHTMILWCDIFCIHVWVYDVVNACSIICYQNLCILLKILLLHSRSVFITLMSSEGLAALICMYTHKNAHTHTHCTTDTIIMSASRRGKSEKEYICYLFLFSGACSHNLTSFQTAFFCSAATENSR